MNSRFTVIFAALVIAFVGIFYVTKHKASAPSSNSNSSVVGQPTNHTYGSGKSGVTLVEYGDLQCPACGAYFPIVKELKEKYKDQITFQFRHFPLVQLHKNAQIASRAAEAAGLQGKFFEMHDMLYENQKIWENSTQAMTIFEDYAAKLGLNVDKFKADASSQTVNESINADIKAGQALGVNSTPTFVLNGKKIDQNPRDAAAFEKLITDAIAAQTK